MAKSTGVGRGGKRPNAGRKPGSRNKLTEEAIAAVRDGGMSPVDFLKTVYRAEVPPELEDRIAEGVDTSVIAALMNWYDRRIDAAKAAAGYWHPKLNAVHNTEDGAPKSLEEWFAKHEPG